MATVSQQTPLCTLYMTEVYSPGTQDLLPISHQALGHCCLLIQAKMAKNCGQQRVFEATGTLLVFQPLLLSDALSHADGCSLSLLQGSLGPPGPPGRDGSKGVRVSSVFVTVVLHHWWVAHLWLWGMDMLTMTM